MNSSLTVKHLVQTSIRVVSHGETAVVSFLQPCVSDTDQITLAAAEIRGFIEQHHPRGVVFDFSHVKFFTSQVLGLILEARVHLLTTRGRVMVASINPELHRVFRITNLDRIMEFFPTCMEAIESTQTH